MSVSGDFVYHRCRVYYYWLNYRIWVHTLHAWHPTLAKSIHIFNSFFYEQLRKETEWALYSRSYPAHWRISSPETAYMSVKRWTSKAKVDIFSKDFIVVPINEEWVFWFWIITSYLMIVKLTLVPGDYPSFILDSAEPSFLSKFTRSS